MQQQYLAALVADFMPETPVGRCRKVTDELALALSRENVQHSVVEGTFVARAVETGVGQAYHWYITVPATEVPDYDGSQPLVLDPTMHQFVEANCLTDDVEAYVAETLFTDSGLLTPSDPLYTAYQ